jgi:arylsulfatase A-like enzyme
VRPNIVYIMADDMGYGDLGCYGATKIPTPNIDRLASEGLRFTDAHSASAVCTPSRYAVLTGRYCWRTSRKRGVGGGFSLPLIDPARLSVASLLRRAGYATAAVGKWHVGLEWQPKAGMVIEPELWEDQERIDYTRPVIGGPTALGFDTFFGIAGSLDMPPYCFIRDAHVVEVPTLEKAPYHAQQKKGFMSPGWRDEDVDVRFAEEAVRFIEDHEAAERDRPFFLYLTPSAPHRPCIPPEFARGRSQAGARGDMVTVVDWLVGRVDDCLARLGLKDNTLVIVTSDNGAQPADVDGETHGHRSCGDLRGFKADIWEGGHRVPYIVRWPGIVAPGGVCSATIGLVDLVATLAELLGIDLEPQAAEDSVSYLPLLREERDAGDRARALGAVHHSLTGVFAVRRGDWKMIAGLGSGGFSRPQSEVPAPGGPEGQLYNLAEDPLEQHNLWLERQDIVQELAALLDRNRESGRSR